MPFDSIHKDLKAMRVTPHLVDYDQARTTHSWEAMRAEMQGLRSGGLNLAHEAVDRHATGVRANHLALRWLGKDGAVRDLTYADMAHGSARFANVLRALGVAKGERVFALMGRVPELYFAALGTLKNVSVFCPLFSQFGPEPVWQRLSRGDAKVLVTTKALYEKKVAALRERLPALQCILLADAEDDLDATVRSLPKLMAAASDEFVIPPTSPEDMALLHFTSGTTGMPKGAVHVHQAALTHFRHRAYVLDLHPDDVFWCTADPGWVTGTSYGIFAPLLHGVTNLVDEADFDAERWYRILQDQKVTVWYTAPTAIRRLMRIPGEPRTQYRSECPAPHSQRGRAVESRGGRVGPAGARLADSRQLVADGNRRHHDRQLRGDGHPTRLHGQAAAGHRRSHRKACASMASKSSRKAMWKANSRSNPAGRRCSAPTCTTKSATRSALWTAGISAAIWRSVMPTATSGSWVVRTTSSRPPATWSGRSRSKALSWNIRRSPRPVSSANRIR
jgi:hypothetical protein